MDVNAEQSCVKVKEASYRYGQNGLNRSLEEESGTDDLPDINHFNQAQPTWMCCVQAAQEADTD
ncbi:MAG: hypothetical protein WBX11_16245 [Thiobacillaceae bacterium]|jgi:hypothetical protein